MKRQYAMLSILLVLLLITQITKADNVSYFQASSSLNQLGGANAKPVTYNLIDGIKGYNVYSNGTFEYKSTGFYFAVYATQIGSPSRNGEGNVHIWVRRDGVDKANSNSVQTVRRGTTSVLVYATIFRAPVGRVAYLVYSAFPDNACTYLGLIATAPPNEPLVPSIISSKIQLSDANTNISYAELTSSQTQLGDSKPTAITLNTVSGKNAIDTTTSANDGAIKYDRSGLYFVMACAQVGSDSNNNKAAGEVHLWLRLNGIDIPNSNTIQTISNGNTAVLISQSIIKFTANDKLQLMFSTTSKKLGVIASTPANEPVVPSMIFVTFRLDTKDSLVPYAQLSSSTTQWGCLTPAVVHLNSNDGSKYITNNNGIITFQQSGTYFLIAAAQVGSYKSKGIGDVHFWMRLNGTDMVDSNTIQTVNKDTAVLICQTAMEIQVGDQVTLVFSTDVTIGTLGLVASQPKKEPTVPSVIFSAFKSTY